jgi:hypothetical protein
MPLDGKTVSKLVKDLDTYRTEKEWADRNAEKVAEKGSKEEVDWLQKRQEKANAALKRLEGNITKAVIKGFPAIEQKIPKPVKVSVPAEEPAVIEIPKPVLERINETLTAQKTQVESYTAIAEQQLKAAERQQETISELKDVTVKDVKERTIVHEISYPSGEDTKDIPKGTTDIDLWTGDVFLGDGTEDRLSDSLERLKSDSIRSISVNVTKAYVIEVDDKADHSMSADDTLVLTGISCRKISITVTEPAKMKFWGSTNPNAVLEGANLAVVLVDESQLFTDKKIRDMNAHNSDIYKSDYPSLSFFVDNDLDQDVSAQVFGNRVNSVTGAVNIGDAFTVSAGDTRAKAITIDGTGMMPYLFVRVTASTTPTSGHVNTYVIRWTR